MKLHIGGKQPKEGWTILNVQKMDYVDIVGDITDLSQFQDESIEEIYASHVLDTSGTFLRTFMFFLKISKILDKKTIKKI